VHANCALYQIPISTRRNAPVAMFRFRMAVIS